MRCCGKSLRRKYILRLDRVGSYPLLQGLCCLGHGTGERSISSRGREKHTRLTATSGDTGSAVAHAFFGLDNVKVVVLFPEKEVTERQRRQMTTLGKNIFPLAVEEASTTARPWSSGPLPIPIFPHSASPQPTP